MNIQELLNVTDGASITVSVTLSDLKEFARTVIKETMLVKQQTDVRDELMTLDEAARYLHVTKCTLWRWRKGGYLHPSSKIGTRLMYKKTDLDEILNAKLV